ncbi:MAG: FGGY-family carbohydrate kinase [Eggerthella lenta]
MHTGGEACRSTNNLITTIAASGPGAGPEYALEGSVFMAGALLQWLRDELGLIDDVAETCAIARSVPDTGGVYVVPAFTGLGAPYWDAEARGAIYRLTRGTGRAHIVRAALESLAYQVHDLALAMEADAGVRERAQRGRRRVRERFSHAVRQSDILRTPLRRPQNAETTALGAAFLAGLATGFWKDAEALCALRSSDDVYEPGMEDERHAKLLEGWARAVKRTMSDALSS